MILDRTEGTRNWLRALNEGVSVYHDSAGHEHRCARTARSVPPVPPPAPFRSPRPPPRPEHGPDRRPLSPNQEQGPCHFAASGTDHRHVATCRRAPTGVVARVPYELVVTGSQEPRAQRPHPPPHHPIDRDLHRRRLPKMERDLRPQSERSEKVTVLGPIQSAPYHPGGGEKSSGISRETPLPYRMKMRRSTDSRPPLARRAK